MYKNVGPLDQARCVSVCILMCHIRYGKRYDSELSCFGDFIPHAFSICK